MILLYSCSSREPVKIGLVADFSGRTSQLGIQARNGMNLAVDELNEKGGIRKRSVEFSFADHKGDPEICKKVVKELIDEGAHIIIGPLVSGMAKPVIEAAEQKGMLVISPTVSTDILTGIDDNFIRSIAPASRQGYYIAQLIKDFDYERIVFIYDKTNKEYSDGVLKGFQKEIENSAIKIEKSFNFSQKEDFPLIAQQLLNIDIDAMVFIANGLDSAGIIQLYAKEKELPPLFGSTWTKVTNIVQYAGRTVEGMYIVDSFVNEKQTPNERAFLEKYTQRFTIEPNIAASSTYESVMIFANAFEKSGSLNSEDIKQEILNMERFDGISDTFIIDPYGDGVRDLSIYLVKDGKYVLQPGRN